MTWSLLASLVLHCGLILIAYAGMPDDSDFLLPEETAVFVDVVPLGEVSNPAPAMPEAEEPPPEPQAAEPEEAPPPDPAVAEPEPAPAPEPELAEPAPEPEPAEPLPEPEPVSEPQIAALPPPAERPDPEPEAKQEAKDIAPALLSLKPKSKPKPPSPPTDFASVLDAVAGLEEAPDQPAEPVPQAPAQRASTRNNPNLPVTITEVDLVRRQIERCWNVPAGVKNMHDLTVAVRVDMNRDGTPRSAVVEDQTRMRVDPQFRTAAESALRAVLNPRCHPFKLPAEKYERWRTMTVVFDPKEMFGT